VALRTAVLHAGTHKTGTTSVQSLFAQAPSLYPQIYYPRAGRPERGNARDGHHNLAWQLKADRRYNSDFGSTSALREELEQQDVDRVLLSSEDFELLYREPARLDPLMEVLTGLGYEVQVLIVFREACSYIESLFHQLHMDGYSGSLTTFLGEVLDGRALVTFDRTELLSAFESAVGVSAVHAIDYDPAEAVGPLVDRLGALFGIPLARPEYPPRRNVRDKAQRKLRAGVLNPHQQRVIRETFG
jgi:hypothetical protein